MLERTTHVRSHDPNSDTPHENLTNPRITAYKFGRSARTDYPSDDSMPLFLSSDGDGFEPQGYQEQGYEQQGYQETWPRERKKAITPSRILTGVLAASAVAIVFALFSVDATRAVIINASASIAGVLPGQSIAAPLNATQLTPSDIQLKGPAQQPAAAAQPTVQTTGNARGPSTAAGAPSREAIAVAYQSALQSQTVNHEPPAAAAPTPRRLDAEELATLLKRAKGLIAIGDIAPARLLLERAADAQEASAALLLAQTYDPAVLGTPDTRSITPDPAAARAWYQKAAQFGSREAQQRLAQMQN